MIFPSRHFLWLAPLIAVVGFISYFSVFYQFPIFRDFPWINLPLVVIGVLLAIWGLFKNWKSTALSKRLLWLVSNMISTGCAALLIFYVFWLSHQMPDSGDSNGSLGEFSLKNSSGELVSLSDFEGQSVLLVFYRGYW